MIGPAPPAPLPGLLPPGRAPGCTLAKPVRALHLSHMSPHPDLPNLGADCSACAALCCVGPPLDAGDLFAFDKPAGTPCPKLGRDHRCTIHDRLADNGMTGCVLFDCAGAGQRVTQMRFNGESWRDDLGLLPAMIRDFEALRPLHQRLTQLVAAADLDLPEALEAHRQALMTENARAWSDTPTLAAAFAAFLDDLRALGHG